MIIGLFFLGSVILFMLIIWLAYLWIVPPDLESYPKDEKKYRIKEVTLWNNEKTYYIQYKQWIFWRTKKQVVYSYTLGPNEQDKFRKEKFDDFWLAKKRIKELIVKRIEKDAKKIKKVKYINNIFWTKNI